MSDKVKEILEELITVKKKYYELKDFYAHEKFVVPLELLEWEKAQLKAIEEKITALENKLRATKLFQNVTISNVYRFAGGLKDKIDRAKDSIEQSKLKRDVQILKITNIYEVAHKEFIRIVNIQGKYTSNLEKLGQSVFNLMSIEFPSWLTKGLKVAKAVDAVATDMNKLLDEMREVFTDKISSYKKSSSGFVDIDINSPLAFQNQKTIDSIEKCISILSVASVASEMVVSFRNKVNEDDSEGNGRESGSEAALQWYVKYYKLEKLVNLLLDSMNDWANINSPSIKYEILQEEFERGFWAKWLPRLKKMKSMELAFENAPGADKYLEKKHETYPTIDFCKELKQKLTDILPLGKMGIEGLGNVSSEDIKKMCKWGEGYQFPYKF